MASRSKKRRPTLTREAILDAALKIVDRDGVEALSMRSLADALGAGAMSLYNHVDGKDDVIDGIVDVVASRFPLPEGKRWKPAMRTSCVGSYEVLLEHPWACSLIASRPSVGPARLAYYDALLGCLRGAGFTLGQAREAFLALDVQVLGFALQQASIPAGDEDPAVVTARMRDALPADVYPNMVAMLDSAVNGRLFTYPFEEALDLLLDGYERKLRAPRLGGRWSAG